MLFVLANVARLKLNLLNKMKKRTRQRMVQVFAIVAIAGLILSSFASALFLLFS